ncbi:MAG: glycoside hydrolase family 140 protein [Bacillota bacterium]|nr:glycoside hydrolase family 140 protein [Bacillota bacterium]
MHTSEALQPLAISSNCRHLTLADGTPFFWLGDTAWELFHRLNREEACHYLDTRARQGFNVIQAVALAEIDGLSEANAHGRLPLLRKEGNHGYGDIEPDLGGPYSYWDHVDYIIRQAARRGLYIALLPTWGDKINRLWHGGPEIFDGRTGQRYGQFIGARYAGHRNIIWVLGGDRNLLTRRHHEAIASMAAGIRQAGARQLMSYHPKGGMSSSEQLHAETWLDFNMFQSGHSRRNDPNYEYVREDWKLSPAKPTLEAEPRYEDHPVDFKAENGYFDAADVRQALYWAVFAGSAGVTYGHHSVWRMVREASDYFPLTWEQALERPAANQVRWLRRLCESRPLLERREAPELLLSNGSGANVQIAARGERYAFIYTPNGLGIEVAPGILPGERLAAAWFNPRSGESTAIGTISNRSTTPKLWPPSTGRGEDWVLQLDSLD